MELTHTNLVTPAFLFESETNNYARCSCSSRTVSTMVIHTNMDTGNVLINIKITKTQVRVKAKSKRNKLDFPESKQSFHKLLLFKIIQVHSSLTRTKTKVKKNKTWSFQQNHWEILNTVSCNELVCNSSRMCQPNLPVSVITQSNVSSLASITTKLVSFSIDAYTSIPRASLISLTVNQVKLAKDQLKDKFIQQFDLLFSTKYNSLLCMAHLPSLFLPFLLHERGFGRAMEREKANRPHKCVGGCVETVNKFLYKLPIFLSSISDFAQLS